MKYCVPCDRQVQPIKKFSWGWFFVITILFIWIAGIWVYPVYYFFLKGKQCPICYGKSFKTKPPVEGVSS
jgi:hypothetical protein